LTILPSYRKAPEHRFPAAHEDAFRAYSWAREHAEAFGGDPTRVIVAGESAGGNLVASLVAAACWQRPEPWAQQIFEQPAPVAAVPMCGFFEISDPARLKRRRRLPIWLDDRVSEVAQAYLGDAGPGGAGHDLADPLVLFERADPPDRPIPPFCMSVGTKDPLLDDTRRMAVALGRLGVDVDVDYYRGEVHAFQAFLWRKNARRSWAQTFRFLNRVVES
jgi:acetyl esterase